nr:hypothetical protein Iba_chr14cCG2700 [Ipomoea batatas]
MQHTSADTPQPPPITSYLSHLPPTQQRTTRHHPSSSDSTSPTNPSHHRHALTHPASATANLFTSPILPQKTPQLLRTLSRWNAPPQNPSYPATLRHPPPSASTCSYEPQCHLAETTVLPRRRRLATVHQSDSTLRSRTRLPVGPHLGPPLH